MERHRLDVLSLAFVLLTFAAGFGLVVYLLLWLLARPEPMEGLAPTAPRILSRPSARQGMGLALLLLGIFNFGFLAMVIYVIAGPDGKAAR